MYNNTLKVSECLSIMKKFNVHMSEPSFRQAIRKNQVKNTVLNSKKEGIRIPFASLINFLIPKLQGNYDAYELGMFYKENTFFSNPLTTSGIGEFHSILAPTIYSNEYIYVVENSHGGTYSSFRLAIDYENMIIHVYEDIDLIRTSMINFINSIIIVDIWNKLDVEITDELLEKSFVNIYCSSRNTIYSTIQSYSLKTGEFTEVQKPIYSRFQELMGGYEHG